MSLNLFLILTQMDFFLCENRCDLQKTYDFISLHMDVLYANQGMTNDFP